MKCRRARRAWWKEEQSPLFGAPVLAVPAGTLNPGQKRLLGSFLSREAFRWRVPKRVAPLVKILPFGGARRSLGIFFTLVLSSFAPLFGYLARAEIPGAVAYVTCEEDGIFLLDLNQCKVLRSYQVDGGRPRGLALTQDGKFLATAVKESGELQIFETDSGRCVQKVRVGNNPEFVKLHPSGRWVFVACEPASTEGREAAVGSAGASLPKDETPSAIYPIEVGSWKRLPPLHGGRETEGLEFSKDGRYLLCANESEGSIRVYDLTNHQEVCRVDLGAYGQRPRGLKRDPVRDRYVVSLENGNKLVILDKNFRAVQSVPCAQGPYGIAFDPKGKVLWVACARSSLLQGFDAERWTLLKEIPVSRRAWHFSFDPEGKNLWVACGRSGEVLVINPQGRKIAQIPGLPMPWGLVTYPFAFGSLGLP
jgi:DNA-binding beta-propeller fold protein YncE